MSGGAASFELTGPRSENPALQAWSDGSIPFEPRTDAEKDLRRALRERLTSLVAAPDEILRARYAGFKSATTDVENVLLYNIDTGGTSFQASAQGGLRFEYDRAAVPNAPSGRPWAAFFEYSVVPRETGFACWRHRRELARWHGASLGSRLGEKRLDQTWLALHRGEVTVADRPRHRDADFAVELRLQPPAGASIRTAGVVKGLVDGVVCALQAHRDKDTLAEVSRRVANTVPISPEEAAALITRQERAVLGAVPRLLHIRGQGVHWGPADERCVAGSVLIEPAAGSQWRLDGEVFEVEQRSRAEAHV